MVGSPLFTEVVDFPNNDPRSVSLSKLLTKMQSNDILSNISGTRALVRMLTAKPMPPAEAETIFASSLLTPAYVRKAILDTLGAAWTNMPKLNDAAHLITVPILITQGTADDLNPYENAVNTKYLLPRRRSQHMKVSVTHRFSSIRNASTRSLQPSLWLLTKRNEMRMQMSRCGRQLGALV